MTHTFGYRAINVFKIKPKCFGRFRFTYKLAFVSLHQFTAVERMNKIPLILSLAQCVL